MSCDLILPGIPLSIREIPPRDVALIYMFENIFFQMPDNANFSDVYDEIRLRFLPQKIQSKINNVALFEQLEMDRLESKHEHTYKIDNINLFKLGRSECVNVNGLL